MVGVVALTLAAHLALSAGAQAQQGGVRLPSAAEPGREAPRPLLPPPSAPGGAIAVPQAPAVEVPAGAEQFRLTLRSIVVDGATVYPAESLRPVFEPLIGREVSVADLFRIAGEIELRYRNDGYITTRVVVPAQTIEDGTFRVRVIEGFVSDIVYPDDIGPALAAVKRLVEPLRGQAPVNVADIERRLLLANDLPGLTVRASLEPAPDALGGSVVVVKTEREPVDASLTLNNRNSPYVGTHQVLSAVALNSFGERADQLRLDSRVSLPFERSWYVGGGYQAMVGSEGMTLGLNGSFSRSKPGLNLNPLDVRSKVVTGTATVTYPVIRSREDNLRVFGEFEYRDVSTDLGSSRFNRDRLRILRSGASYDRTDSWQGITAIRATVHKGLDLWDATDRGDDLASRERGRSDFTKLTGDITRLQQLPENFSLLATATVQHSFDPLLASEEIALGGPNFGRAFNEGEVSDDNGWAGSVELRYTPYVPPNDVLQGVQLFGYVDAGQVWSRGSIGSTGRSTLTSIGGGVRANLLDRFFASLEVDKPMSRDVQTEGDRGARVFFTITVQY